MRALLLPLLLLASCSEKPAEVAASPTSSPSAPAFPRLDLAFATPASWIRVEPENRLRKAQYIVPSKSKGAEALLVVSHFKGTTMTPDAIAEQWSRQVDGADAKPETVAAALKVTMVDLAGTYRPDGGDAVPDARFLGALVETPEGPWFLKLYGPAATVGAWRDEFVALLKSVKKID